MHPDIKNVLVVAAHPDDGEFSCGATISRLLEEGKEIRYVVFSPCKKSVPEGYPEDILYQELDKAAETLGLKKSNVHTYDFEVRELQRDRQLILEELVQLNRRLRPDLVFMPESADLHQDHKAIHQEARRAFKNCCQLGYELPWNQFGGDHKFYVKLEQHHLDAKQAAIRCYQSQGFREYYDEELFRSLARVRGVQAKSKYAESFEMIKWIY